MAMKKFRKYLLLKCGDLLLTMFIVSTFHDSISAHTEKSSSCDGSTDLKVTSYICFLTLYLLLLWHKETNVLSWPVFSFVAWNFVD